MFENSRVGFSPPISRNNAQGGLEPTLPDADENRLRRQQRHHRRRPGSRRGDGPLLRRELLQPQFDVRAGPAGPRGPRSCPADGRAALRARRRQADPLHRLCFGEQQHGDPRRGQGQSAAAAHHHHLGRAPGRAGGLQGPRSATATASPGWMSTATAISISASSSAPWAPRRCW